MFFNIKSYYFSVYSGYNMLSWRGNANAKKQFSKRLEDKNSCYRELKNETFIDQNLITQWGITKE